MKYVINFGYDALNIALDQTGASKQSNPKNLYLAYVKGWFSNDSGTESIYKLFNTPQRTGYKFNGWNTKADGTGTSYANKYSAKNLTDIPNGTIPLYAKWK